MGQRRVKVKVKIKIKIKGVGQECPTHTGLFRCLLKWTLLLWALLVFESMGEWSRFRELCGCWAAFFWLGLHSGRVRGSALPRYTDAGDPSAQKARLRMTTAQKARLR